MTDDCLVNAYEGMSRRQFLARMRATGGTVEFVIYPGAPQAFHADYRPSYRAEAAKDGWSRCLGCLRRYLA